MTFAPATYFAAPRSVPPPGRIVGDDLARFWAKVDVPFRPSACWTWVGAIKPNGYGILYWGGTVRSAHRTAFELFVGSIPAGQDIDHLCRNRACVNPTHLEPVTHRENMRRGDGFAGKQARQTHCKRGHEFSEANTRIDSGTKRSCRTCDRDRARARRAA